MELLHSLEYEVVGMIMWRMCHDDLSEQPHGVEKHCYYVVVAYASDCPCFARLNLELGIFYEAINTYWHFGMEDCCLAR